MPKVKEQRKSPTSELNEIKINYLPPRVQNNIYKNTLKEFNEDFNTIKKDI